MVTRPARFGDIPAIVALLQDGYRRSHYAASVASIDERETKRLLVQAIQRHGSHHLGGTWVVVAETGGRITGVLVGTLARLFAISDRLMASDLFWLAAEDVDPSDPVRLMKSMVEWARAAPDCIEVKCGTSAIIRADPKEAGRALERLGMQHYGEIYRMELAR